MKIIISVWVLYSTFSNWLPRFMRKISQKTFALKSTVRVYTSMLCYKYLHKIIIIFINNIWISFDWFVIWIIHGDFIVTYNIYECDIFICWCESWMLIIQSLLAYLTHKWILCKSSDSQRSAWTQLICWSALHTRPCTIYCFLFLSFSTNRSGTLFIVHRLLINALLLLLHIHSYICIIVTLNYFNSNFISHSFARFLISIR